MRDFQKPGRSVVLADNGICATSHPLAAQVAIGILQEGGNAVDAAIAGALVLGICEPQMTGIGGDCFVLLKPAGSEKVQALNGSGRAPAAADAEALREAGLGTMPLANPHAVTVPGAVDAFCHLAESHGTLGLDRILAPAIRYAEDGVPVAPRVARDWGPGAARLQGVARRWYLNDGQPLVTGQRFRAPGQAEVLRRIAKHGRDGFYSGEVLEDMLAALRGQGGRHTAEDFANTACTPCAPVTGSYKGHELLEHPPNSQGAAAILLLNILSHFDIAAMDPLGAERIHIETEAAKLAYDTRNRVLGDPDHVTRLDHMLSPDTAARLAALVDPARAMQSATRISEAVHRDTIYLTVVDRDRMAVSLIYSIFHSFGAGIASEKFGILFQNRGSGFSLEKGHPNELAGGKRPLHTIIPAMLARDGRVTMPFGVMGGHYQSHGHARFVSNLLDFGMDLQEAVDAPRSFCRDGVLEVESRYDDAVRAALADKGHDVVIPAAPLGGAQAIRIDDSGVLWGASDGRKDGCALGY